MSANTPANGQTPPRRQTPLAARVQGIYDTGSAPTRVKRRSAAKKVLAAVEAKANGRDAALAIDQAVALVKADYVDAKLPFIVCESKYGLKVPGARLKAAAVLKDAQIAVMTTMNKDEDEDDVDPEVKMIAGVQRRTTRSRIEGLLGGVRPYLHLAKRGVEIFEDFFHIVLFNESLNVVAGSQIDLARWLVDKNTKLAIVDGAGRTRAILELAQEDLDWIYTYVYVQFYINPSRAQMIELMETLNSKKSVLEKNFDVSLQAELYIEKFETEPEALDYDHLLAHFATKLAKDDNSPLKNKIRFHDSPKHVKGPKLNNLRSAMFDAVFVGGRFTEESFMQIDTGAFYARLLTCVNAIKLACGPVGVFDAEDWEGKKAAYGAPETGVIGWHKGAGTWLNVLLFAMMHASYLEWANDDDIPAGGAKVLNSKYGFLFTAFMRSQNTRVGEVFRFTGNGVSSRKPEFKRNLQTDINTRYAELKQV